MKNIILIIFIQLLIMGCDFKSSKEYLKEAWVLEDQQRYAEAIPLLNKAIEKDPKFIEAYLSRGSDKSFFKDFKGAIADYNQVIKLDPNNTLALFNIGNNYKRLGIYPTAIIYYNKAFQSKGGDQAYLDLTPNPMIQGYQFDVRGYEISYERALGYLQMDSLRMAFDDFHNCIRSNYQLKESYYWLGIISKAYRKNDQACTCFLKSKQLGNQSAAIEFKKNCPGGN